MAYERKRMPCRGCGGPKPPGQGVTYCLDCNVSCDRHARYTNKCTECVRIYNKAATLRVKDDPELGKRRNRKRKATRYGISIDQVVVVESAERCEICNEVAKLVIDHDHVTLEYRGAICDLCNKALGHVKDNVQTLRNMIDYLEGTK